MADPTIPPAPAGSTEPPPEEAPPPAPQAAAAPPVAEEPPPIPESAPVAPVAEEPAPVEAQISEVPQTPRPLEADAATSEAGAVVTPQALVDEPVPDVVTPGAPGVEAGELDPETGQQTFFLDRDGDGVAETEVVGAPLDDGSFKVVEVREIDAAGVGDAPVEDVALEEDSGVPPVVKADDPSVAGGEIEEIDGQQVQDLLIDLDGDGLADASAKGIVQEDGTLKIVESERLEEPVPLPGRDDVGAEVEPPTEPPADVAAGVVEEPPPVEHAAPPDAHAIEDQDADIDPPDDLFHEAPSFAAGSADHPAPPNGGDTGALGDAAPLTPAESTDAPDGAAPPAYDRVDSPPEADEEPVSALSREDEDDPGLLERIADAVGDFFTDNPKDPS